MVWKKLYWKCHINNICSWINNNKASYIALEKISNGTDRIGYINAYNDDTHHVGISWRNYLVTQTIPALIIDGNKYDIVLNNRDTDDNYKIANIVPEINESYGWRIHFSIYVDGQLFDKYVKLIDC